MDEEDVIWSLDHVSPAAASAGPAAPGGSQGSLLVKDETTSGVATLTSTASSNLFADLDQDTSGKFSRDFFFWSKAVAQRTYYKNEGNLTKFLGTYLF